MVRAIDVECSVRACRVLPSDVPPDATIESLVTEVFPALHARLAGGAAAGEVFSIAVRIGDRPGWTARIDGPRMTVEPGEAGRPTLWVHASELAALRFLEDATGPKRLLPSSLVGGGGGAAPAWTAVALSDPRVIRRVALVSGRIELAVVDDDGARLAMVFGFGDAARKPIDPERPDAVAEGTRATLERALRGDLPPAEAISSGALRVRGSRLLVMQLALAVAPFYVRRPPR
jgi:hypothetical protein